MDYFEELCRDVEELSLHAKSDRVLAEKRLAAKGTQLFQDLLPAALREQLWELRGQIRELQVISDEPWIPWELLKLRSDHEGRRISGPFFGEAFAITRWLRGYPEVLHLPLRHLALVVVQDSELSSATRERDFLLSLQAEERSVRRIKARFHEVTTALASGRYDAWHFTGHGVTPGEDPNRWGIRLESYEQLRPEDLSTDAGNLGAASPLIFLNGCHTGRGAFSLTGIGGWARQFLEAGAGAFIGAQWAIPDKMASAFTEAFYGRYLAGSPIAEAARLARLELRKRFPGDPAWLTYTVFAHPLASCKAPTAARRRRLPSALRLLLAAMLLLILQPHRVFDEKPVAFSPTEKGPLVENSSGTERSGVDVEDVSPAPPKDVPLALPKDVPPPPPTTVETQPTPEPEPSFEEEYQDLLRQARYAEAEPYARRLAERFPENEDYRFALYECRMHPWLDEIIGYQDQQQFDFALVSAEKLRDIDPSAPIGSAVLGLSCVLRNWDTGDRVSAVRYLREAVQLHEGLPESSPFRLGTTVLASLYSGLGVSYSRQEAYSEAEDSFYKALQLDPDIADGRENLELAIQQRRRNGGEGEIRWVSIAELLGIE